MHRPTIIVKLNPMTYSVKKNVKVSQFFNKVNLKIDFSPQKRPVGESQRFLIGTLNKVASCPVLAHVVLTDRYVLCSFGQYDL